MRSRCSHSCSDSAWANHRCLTSDASLLWTRQEWAAQKCSLPSKNEDGLSRSSWSAYAAACNLVGEGGSKQGDATTPLSKLVSLTPISAGSKQGNATHCKTIQHIYADMVLKGNSTVTRGHGWMGWDGLRWIHIQHIAVYDGHGTPCFESNGWLHGAYRCTYRMEMRHARWGSSQIEWEHRLKACSPRAINQAKADAVL